MQFVGFIISFILLVLYILGRKKVADTSKQNAALHQENEVLRPYQAVIDIDSYLSETKQHAEQISAEASTEAKRIQDEATSTAERIKKEALTSATRINADASDRAHTMIQEANERALAIAKDALNAKENFEFYQAGIEAMKRQMSGYGDEFLIPHVLLLEELAEQLDHTEAGQLLKKQSSHCKMMAKSGNAASCDYVRADRRQYATRFVLDAFNGKVEAILTRVKHDNYGKLRQRIEDAFHLVNENGRGFRNARIEKVYLDARLEELRLATIALELKKRFQEEQREIKRQIREEERAQKEYEKAIREAEKERRAVEKALAKAQKQYELAAGEERQKLEAQLAELRESLAEAESKNQRTMSMAQQTRRGHVYVVSNVGSFGESIYKVGMTRRLEPMDRVKELGDASVPFPFDVHAMIYSEDVPKLEKLLHREFDARRVNHVNRRKEFFKIRIESIRRKCEELGVKVHWTMSAAAAEYRESKSYHRLTSAPPPPIQHTQISPEIAS